MLGLLLTILLPLSPPTEGDESPTRTVVHHPEHGGLIALREVNDERGVDLIFIQPEGFGLRYLRADGTYPAEHDTFLPWPGDHLTWDVVDLDGDGRHEIVTLTGEGRVHAWRPGEDGQFGEGELLLESRSYLPRGVSRMRFARDVDGDDLVDFALPAAGTFRIHLQSSPGEWGSGIEIQYEAEVSYEVGDPEDLDGTFGQTLRIPWFQLEDIDGDGSQDLISQTEERVDFHLARPELSATPTWSLDLVGLAKELPKREGIDLDDLLANIEQGVKWNITEVDGKAPRDLVLQLGATIKVYLGGSVTGHAKRPDDVLKISGNLLHFFVRDVQGDALPDLQLLRGEKISLGRVLRWLILPGSLDFQFFTYRNEDGAFTRRPTRTNTVSLKIPRLLSLIDDVEEIEAEVERQRKIPARRADFDGDGVLDDVVDVEGGKVLLFDGCAPLGESRFSTLQGGEIEEIVEEFVLNDVDALEDGDTKTIDLGDLEQWEFSPGAALREARQGHVPFQSVEGPPGEGELHLRPRDLDGDGRDDLVIWVELGDNSHLVQFSVLSPK